MFTRLIALLLTTSFLLGSTFGQQQPVLRDSSKIDIDTLTVMIEETEKEIAEQPKEEPAGIENLIERVKGWKFKASLSEEVNRPTLGFVDQNGKYRSISVAEAAFSLSAIMGLVFYRKLIKAKAKLAGITVREAQRIEQKRHKEAALKKQQEAELKKKQQDKNKSSKTDKGKKVKKKKKLKKKGTWLGRLFKRLAIGGTLFGLGTAATLFVTSLNSDVDADEIYPVHDEDIDLAAELDSLREQGVDTTLLEKYLISEEDQDKVISAVEEIIEIAEADDASSSNLSTAKYNALSELNKKRARDTIVFNHILETDSVAQALVNEILLENKEQREINQKHKIEMDSTALATIPIDEKALIARYKNSPGDRYRFLMLLSLRREQESQEDADE